MPQKAKKKSHLVRRRTLLPLLIVVIGLTIFIVLKQTVLKPDTPYTSASSATKGEVTRSTSSNNQLSDSSPASNGYGQDKINGNSDSSTGTYTQLVSPSGDFVSNHHPNLSGTPAPNLIASSCTTTPGASCKIIFTKSGVTKELPAETTDVGGSAFWNWKLQDYGITEGSWSIKAVASLNGQTINSTDAQLLVVSQ